MWINVKDAPYSAQGNGTADDTTAIQNAINAAQAVATPDKRDALYFPLATYRITSTLEVYRNQGLRFIGVGNVAGLPVYVGGYADPPARQTGAVLYWDGPPGGTLLRIKGSYDGAIENLTFVGATPQKYKFDTGTGSSDPGESYIRFNNGTFASVTQIYANIKNFFNVEIPDWLDGLDSGTARRLTIQKRDASDFAIFDVTGSVTGSGTWRTINVKPVQASGTGTFALDGQLTLSFVRNGGTPQRYMFQTSTDPSTSDGQLRFDNGTFANITKIYVNQQSINGFIVQDWLESIDDRADVRVTVNHITNSAITRIFKVTSVTASGGTRVINVTPIHSAGTLSDTDPVVLICSTPTPIRDRAGALVAQVSEVGWPSGGTLIEHCTFLEADDGLQLDDESAPTNNCADNTVIHSSFTGCGNGVKVNSIQVLNNTFMNCDFNECDVGINHAFGGDTRIVGASMNGFAGGIFLKFGPGAGDNNASTVIVSGVRLEMVGGIPSLLETGESQQLNILIDGFSWAGVQYPDAWNSSTQYDHGDFGRIDNTIYSSTVAGTNTNTNNNPATNPDKWKWWGDWIRPVRLGTATNLMIRGANIKGPFASITAGAGKSSLLMQRCRFYPATPSTLITADANGYWRTIDCTDNAGNLLLNADNFPASVDEFAKLTQPAPTGQGEQGRDWTFTGAAGHSDNGFVGFGGTGSSFLVTLGTGGAGNAGGAGGGPGGSARLIAGTGGSCNQSAAAAGNGGTLYLQPGPAGTPSGGAAAGSVGNVVVNDDQVAGAQFIVYGESQFLGGAMKMQELSSTPSNPASGTEAKLYVKSDKLIVQFNDSGTVRYKYLPLAAPGRELG